MNRGKEGHGRAAQKEGSNEGLNTRIKQSEVRDAIKTHGLSFGALVETHVKSDSLSNIVSLVFGSWKWVSNSPVTENVNKVFFITIVYGSNSIVERKDLWSGLRKAMVLMGNMSWVIMGDFCWVFCGFPRIKLTQGLTWITKPHWFDKSHRSDNQTGPHRSGLIVASMRQATSSRSSECFLWAFLAAAGAVAGGASPRGSSRTYHFLSCLSTIIRLRSQSKKLEPTCVAPTGLVIFVWTPGRKTPIAPTGLTIS
ncbi:hypothetical protein OSB04_028362 [Centaurea solstitialis]|uniref:Uncharacterized protein n=1 Tax=Centaurea solstitialis TaxID=347529 RepID=A0AA38SSH8_9ASTR|nr:hypothetical protein OSB04_028362 [Centaurea solstitialis]